MKIFSILPLLFIYLQASSQSFHLDEIKTLDKKQKATHSKELASKFIIAFISEDYSSLKAHFSDSLWLNYDSTKAKIAWKKELHNKGYFQKILDVKWLRRAEENRYLVGLAFEKGKSDLSLAFNKDNKVTDFKISPFQDVNKWQLPSYADTNLFTIKELKIPTQLPLLAELTLPKSVENPPILVLVHGSGPNDMDETLGPNKIFKDIAYGLASRGIGVLRYNKVSFDYRSKMLERFNEVTIDMEVTKDAVAALKLADSLTQGNVFLAGHSLGGHLAPKIAERARLDGVIILAGNVSPLEDLIIEQLDYLKQNDSTTQLTDFVIKFVKWQVENLKSNNYDSSTRGSTLPFNLPAIYWLSLKNYKPNQLSIQQDIPYLILNGGRDYQVTNEEAEKWQNGNDHPLSKTIIYPKMNHLFYEGEGLLLPSEYEKEAHFDEKVLSDIEQWISQ